MWQDIDARLALLELLSRGSLKRRQSQQQAYDALHELPWTRATGRRNQISLVEDRRRDLVVLIDRVWPTWRDELAELVERGLPPTPDGRRRLNDLRRAESLGELPDRLNRHTAAAHTAPHAKATLSKSRTEALGKVETTHDGSVRLRLFSQAAVRSSLGEVDLLGVADVLGEVSVPERAMLDGLALDGNFRAMLLVENLGAWRDFPPVDGWVFVHVPGWDTATVKRWLELVRVPVAHFGDLDPNGVRIYLHLRELLPELMWFVPWFWSEYLPLHGLRREWPDDLDLAWAPELVRELASRGLWLEQERLVSDARVGEALRALGGVGDHDGT